MPRITSHIVWHTLTPQFKHIDVQPRIITYPSSSSSSTSYNDDQSIKLKIINNNNNNKWFYLVINMLLLKYGININQLSIVLFLKNLI